MYELQYSILNSGTVLFQVHASERQTVEGDMQGVLGKRKQTYDERGDRGTLEYVLVLSVLAPLFSSLHVCCRRCFFVFDGD